MCSRKSILLLFLLAIGAYALPQHKDSFVVLKKRDTSGSQHEMQSDQQPADEPKITELMVFSNIANRFASTEVTTKVVNYASYAQQTEFTVVLPNSAFVTGFVMEIRNRNYTGYTQVKSSAEDTYNQAVDDGTSAGHVSTVRNSNKFSVKLNLEARTRAKFYLFYEELLVRNGHYEHVVNIQSKQPIPTLIVDAYINETSPLSFVKTPNLRSGNILSNDIDNLDPGAVIIRYNDKSAFVTFHPSEAQQNDFGNLLSDKDNSGLNGQFVIQYDVERTTGGEVLIKDGYFVHYFAPPNLPIIPKYVVFVLDTSGSMSGRRLEQLKEAMDNILPNLNDFDAFSIAQFHDDVIVLDIHNMFRSTNVKSGSDVQSYQYPAVYSKDKNNVQMTKNVISSFIAQGGTNMFDSMRVALHLVDLNKKSSNKEPMIIFLTDGEPTTGETNLTTIMEEIHRLNKHRAPIFSLSFGDGADKDFLQRFSLKNYGFARHIYESADVVVQLNNFYQDISSPVLKNVTFKYADNVRELSRTNFPTLFKGGELVITGKIDKGTQFQMPVISAQGKSGTVSMNSTIKAPIGDMERVWAYVTVQQMFEKQENQKDEKQLDKMLNLAMQYSFVTPITNMVVVEPNKTVQVNVMTADGTKPKEVLPVPIKIIERFRVDPPNTEAPSTEHPLPWVNKLSKMLSNATFEGDSIDETQLCLNVWDQPGVCTLVMNCELLHDVIETFEDYMDYYCRLDEKTVGVCCPTVFSN